VFENIVTMKNVCVTNMIFQKLNDKRYSSLGKIAQAFEE